MKDAVYIVDAKRTPIGKYGGGLIDVSATDLASIVIEALLKKNPTIIDYIDEVILGNVLSAGLGQNPARIAAYKSGIHKKVPSCTVNKICGSSLKAIIMGMQSIVVDDAQVIIAGGMENMSRCPYIIDNYRFGAKIGHQMIRDAMIYDGLFCSLIGEPMGLTAEHIAKKYNITRKEQDTYAVNSHVKALNAIVDNSFSKQIVSVPITKGNSTLMFSVDEQPRKDTNLEKLSQLRPGFLAKGTITAGNACPLNDGAAAVVLASVDFVHKHHMKPLAKVIQYAYTGLDPKFMGLGGYYAAKLCLAKAKLTTKDIDFWEINEAFACQSIAVQRLLDVDERIINVHGGAIALGHPIGASGARILTTLLYELKNQSKQFGMASLCIGGGQGIAMLVENL